jgi:hypothetical protein
MLKARLHPKWVGGHDGYCYSVIQDGKLLVDRSRDPECDAARALVEKGITGKLTLLDGKTGKPRTIIDIVKAARLCTKEGPLRFARYEGRPNSPHSPEVTSDGDQEAA